VERDEDEWSTKEAPRDALDSTRAVLGADEGWGILDRLERSAIVPECERFSVGKLTKPAGPKNA
jgi:hypothetical protein